MLLAFPSTFGVFCEDFFVSLELVAPVLVVVVAVLERRILEEML